MDRNPGCETQVFARRCCRHRRHSQEVAHFTKMPIACVESVFTVLRGKFCVGNYVSEQSPSSGQVRYPRRSSDDLNLYYLYPGLLCFRRGLYPLHPGTGGTYPGTDLVILEHSSSMYVFSPRI